MPEKTQNTNSTSAEERAKQPWEPFRLEDRGNLADVIRGGGKTGNNTDSDGNLTRKRGTG